MIDAERFKECSELLALYLNPVDDEEVTNFEGQEIKLSQMLPFVFKHLNKVVIKHDIKSEEVFLWVVDAIHYFTCISDEKPETYFTTPENKELIETGIKDSEIKFKIKTK